MRFAFVSAALAACFAVSIPDSSFAKQNGMRSSGATMRHGYMPRAPLNPPRFQGVRAGPLKGPARPPAGFRDRSIPQAALPQQAHRHSLRGRHGLAFGIGSAYASSYAYAYSDPAVLSVQDAQLTPQRAYPAGQCWTERVRVSNDRSRDVNVTRC